MKAVPVALLLVFLFSGCPGSGSDVDKPLLSQSYLITATKNETKVRARVFHFDRNVGPAKESSPLFVEFNGSKLTPAPVPSSVAPSFQIEGENDRDLKVVAVDITEPIDGYEITLDSFSKVAKFTVAINETDRRESSATFSPVEIAGTPEIRLSRNKSNEIPFVGGARGSDTKLVVGFVGSGDLFDDDQVRVDWSKRLIVFPPGSLRRMPYGPATLFVISSDNDFLPDQYVGKPGLVSNLSSYIFSFSDEVSVIITD